MKLLQNHDVYLGCKEQPLLWKQQNVAYIGHRLACSQPVLRSNGLMGQTGQVNMNSQVKNLTQLIYFQMFFGHDPFCHP